MWIWKLALGLLVAIAPISEMGYAQAKKKAPAAKKGKKADTPAAPAAEPAAPAAEPAAETPAAPTAHHKAKGADSEYQVAYGMAGCGLGGMILKSNTKGSQIGAWFLNMTGVQVSAISCTKSSGCENGPDLRTAQVEQKVFVDVNLASLSREAAQGGGQHLSAFAAILGCEGEARDRFMEVSRSHYSEIFSTDNSEQVLSNYNRTIEGDATLAGQCSRLTTT